MTRFAVVHDKKNPATSGLYNSEGDRVANCVGGVISVFYGEPKGGGQPTDNYRIRFTIYRESGATLVREGEVTKAAFDDPAESKWVAQVLGTAAHVDEQHLDDFYAASVQWSNDANSIVVHNSHVWRTPEGIFIDNSQATTFGVTINRELTNEFGYTFYRLRVEESGEVKYITVPFEAVINGNAWNTAVSSTGQIRNAMQVG